MLAPAGLSAQSRAKKPNDITLELGGRCVLYCLSYQRMLGNMVGLELGGSFLFESGVALTGGFRFYAMSGKTSPYLSGGLALVMTEGYGGDTGAYLFVSPGIECRGSANFVFRAGVNLLILGGAAIWPGLTIGYAF